MNFSQLRIAYLEERAQEKDREKKELEAIKESGEKALNEAEKSRFPFDRFNSLEEFNKALVKDEDNFVKKHVSIHFNF